MSDNGYSPEIIRIGIPDKFIPHGTIPELYKLCGMDVESITNVIARTKHKLR
jgi:1-deoxy-D-xylulose-5-phosphate synthase